MCAQGELADTLGPPDPWYRDPDPGAEVLGLCTPAAPATTAAVPKEPPPLRQLPPPRPRRPPAARGPLLDVGENVRLLVDLVFRSGWRARRGEHAVVVRAPGKRAGEICQVRTESGLVVGVRAGQIQVETPFSRRRASAAHGRSASDQVPRPGLTVEPAPCSPAAAAAVPAALAVAAAVLPVGSPLADPEGSSIPPSQRLFTTNFSSPLLSTSFATSHTSLSPAWRSALAPLPPSLRNCRPGSSAAASPRCPQERPAAPGGLPRPGSCAAPLRHLSSADGRRWFAGGTAAAAGSFGSPLRTARSGCFRAAPRQSVAWFGSSAAFHSMHCPGARVEDVTDELRRVLPPEAIRLVTKWFNEADKGRDRKLNRDEAVEWFRALYAGIGCEVPGPEFLREQVVECFRTYDKDRDGALSVPEACGWLRASPLAGALRDRAKGRVPNAISIQDSAAWFGDEQARQVAAACAAAAEKQHELLQQQHRDRVRAEAEPDSPLSEVQLVLNPRRKAPNGEPAHVLFSRLGSEAADRQARAVADKYGFLVDDSDSFRGMWERLKPISRSAALDDPEFNAVFRAMASKDPALTLGVRADQSTASVEPDLFGSLFCQEPTVALSPTAGQSSEFARQWSPRQVGDAAAEAARKRVVQRQKKGIGLGVDDVGSPRGNRGSFLAAAGSPAAQTRMSVVCLSRQRYEGGSDLPVQDGAAAGGPKLFFHQIVGLRSGDSDGKPGGMFKWMMASEKIKNVNKNRAERIMGMLRVSPFVAAKVLRWIARAKSRAKERWYEGLSADLKLQARQQGVVTEIVQGKDKGKAKSKVQQGDEEMLAPEMLKKRLALRDHKDVQEAIGKLWQAAPHCPEPHTDMIDRQIYEYVALSLLKGMVRNAGERRNLAAQVTEDWWAESRMEWFMDSAGFYQVMYDFVDTWTLGTDAKEYVELAHKARKMMPSLLEFCWSVKLAQKHWEEWEERTGRAGVPPKLRPVTPLSPAEVPFVAVRGGGGQLRTVARSLMLAGAGGPTRALSSRMLGKEGADAGSPRAIHQAKSGFFARKQNSPQAASEGLKKARSKLLKRMGSSSGTQGPSVEVPVSSPTKEPQVSEWDFPQQDRSPPMPTPAGRPTP
eukprot:TRINITY_DN3234_c0_g2_i1.p1 TRINITY_DN3234_c0_g2~~TRINITY_DN3234_c0_g2_i1.p1  ORF type:complete len:1112 (+),score=315.48 TRINITY_DN3234_c0_g2_i1:77-3412(+)